MSSLSVQIISTVVFDGQKPGTSGLRKSTKTFQQQHYTENFVQSILNAMSSSLKGSSLVVGGDGRFFCEEAVAIILSMCAANEVSKVIVGQNGILSTPAVSTIIRKHKTSGGIVLTASHNPGGPNADFGIKFNSSNGGPAPEHVTNEIYEITKTLKNYKKVPDLHVDISQVGSHSFDIEGVGKYQVDVVDSVSDYLELMKELFDFDKIKDTIDGKNGLPKLNVLVNALHGVTGPYVKRILCQELGVTEGNLKRCNNLTDFGGCHPDPNLTYASELVDDMKNGNYDVGAAFDGDGDRNMILGAKGFFISPCDSLAVIADNAQAIPYFQKTGIKGLARSMPTSGAVDRVAVAKKLSIYEVPTGWKFFGNLMDANKLSLCGEESFGTGSDHIREKDGIWALLAWLSILADKRQNSDSNAVSVQSIMENHWKVYGRNFFTRYDYENCESKPAEAMMSELLSLITAKDFIKRKFTADAASGGDKVFEVASACDFSYKDPVDQSVTTKQGILIVFTDGSRIVFRLSGTGSSGATIRMYIDSYTDNAKELFLESQVALLPLIKIALEISQLQKFVNRDKPDVIT